MKKALVFLLFTFICIAPVKAGDDFHYWSNLSLKLLETEQFEFSTFSNLRLFDDAGEVGLWYISPRLRWKASRYLHFGLNYTYLETEVKNMAAGTDEFKHHNRLELEINPKWQWKDKIKIQNRNRVEFRWIEDKGSDHGRFRQKWAVVIPFHDQKFIKDFYFDNEFFWDFNREVFNEDRWVPAGFTLKLHEKILLKLFYMIQWQKTGNDWRSNQIFGTQVNMTLV